MKMRISPVHILWCFKRYIWKQSTFIFKKNKKVLQLQKMWKEDDYLIYVK